jgi:hypothetical protein
MSAVPSPRFCTIATGSAISGMGRRATYDALGRGDLRAVKVGTRTLIDCESGLAWLGSLQPAKIRPPRRQRPLPEQSRRPHAKQSAGQVPPQ